MLSTKISTSGEMMKNRNILPAITLLVFFAACGGEDTNDTSDSTPVCGDHKIGGEEICDGTDFGTATCEGEGFASGDLQCSEDCTTLLTTGCTPRGESCESPKLVEGTGDTADSSNAADNHTPSCGEEGNPDLVYELVLAEASGVVITVDGFDSVLELRGTACDDANGVVIECNDDFDETYDGNGSRVQAELLDAGSYYIIVDAYDTGDSFNMRVEVVAGGLPRCGDGIIQAALGEACDGSALDDQSCTSLGWELGGTLKCSEDCSALDITECSTAAVCGDGNVAGPELCDGQNIATATCEEVDMVSGDPACGDDCLSFTRGSCVGILLTSCGDSVVDGYEECDTDQYISMWNPDVPPDCSQTDSTPVSCGEDCMLDYSGCQEPDYCAALGYYDDGTCDPCEYWGGSADSDCAIECAENGSCEDTLLEHGNIWSCQAAGYVDPDCGLCGNDIIEGGESCDGSDLNDYSCTSVGYDGGVLSCRADCIYDFSGCY